MRSGSLLHLAWRSLSRHRLSNALTVFTCSLAVGLSLAVFALNSQARAAFTNGSGGYDAVLGARGSRLQLVLNAVFHLETSPGNIPWSVYEAVAAKPGVLRAMPMALGDNYRGFRLVGITQSYFTDPPADAATRQLESGGRYFDEGRREAVIGSFVASQTGLRVGSTFSPYHGLVFDESAKHQEQYVVTGVLQPTNSPADKVLFLPIEGIYRMTGHVLRGDGRDYKARSGESINKHGQIATLAFPIGQVIGEVFEKLGWAHKILACVSYLVLLIVGISILTSIVQTLSNRKREFAVLRALGMPKPRLFALLIVESTLLAACGSLGGFLVYGFIVTVASQIIRYQIGVVINPLSFHPAFVWVPLGMTGLGALAGLLPAWKAYQTEVARHLGTDP